MMTALAARIEPTPFRDFAGGREARGGVRKCRFYAGLRRFAPHANRFFGSVIFASAGSIVANLTATVRKTLLAISFAIATSTAASAESWSVGAATGPFIFGTFAERTVTINTETGTATAKSRLSAATRAGAMGDVQLDFNDRWAARLEATWTQAPLRLKSSGGSQGVTIDAGHVNVTTFVAPLILHINPHGAFRFEIEGGPAYALYNVHRRAGAGISSPLFEGTRGRLGGAAGVGVAWWWTPRFAAEWRAQDIVTSSPFRETDIIPSGQGVHIPKPQNGHTTVGIRYRF
jgi:hypothetical protein